MEVTVIRSPDPDSGYGLDPDRIRLGGGVRSPNALISNFQYNDTTGHTIWTCQDGRDSRNIPVKISAVS